jgi:hypothetical protein
MFALCIYVCKRKEISKREEIAQKEERRRERSAERGKKREETDLNVHGRQQTADSRHSAAGSR